MREREPIPGTQPVPEDHREADSTVDASTVTIEAPDDEFVGPLREKSRQIVESVMQLAAARIEQLEAKKARLKKVAQQLLKGWSAGKDWSAGSDELTAFEREPTSLAEDHAGAVSDSHDASRQTQPERFRQASDFDTQLQLTRFYWEIAVCSQQLGQLRSFTASMRQSQQLLTADLQVFSGTEGGLTEADFELLDLPPQP